MVLWLVFASAASGPLADDANARSRYSAAQEKKQKKAEEPAPPAAPLFFVISLKNQHVSVYSSDGLYARSPVSTGQPGYPTPRGIFTIIGKERMHHSNIYSGAPMPYMQRITWSGIAMHHGVVPGYPASHGCIRLPYDFARRMFAVTQGNERVIIGRGDIAPAPFAHPKLPAPALLPVPRADAVASIYHSMLHYALAAIEGVGNANGLTTIAAEAEDVGVPPDGAAQKLVNPHEFAKTMRALAAKKAEATAVAANAARAAVQAKAREMRVAAVDLRKAQVALSNAKYRLEGIERRTGKVSRDFGGVKETVEARTEPAAKVTEAEALVEVALRAKSQKDDELAAAVKAFEDLDAAQKAASEGVKFWTRRLSPVSVFISRKTQRLYIRQNFTKVFDAPVTIRDLEKPLGTHLYMAVQPVKGEPTEAPKLRWLSLTVPDAASDGDRPGRRHSRYNDDETDNAPPASAITAAAALDRIEIPAEASRKISEMLWAGGSIIVSDSGISRETGDYTDFVILTR